MTMARAATYRPKHGWPPRPKPNAVVKLIGDIARQRILDYLAAERARDDE